ncbi:MAG: hypothetical protein HC925_07645, partial [Coleofasciculaceae cyanobacterium SM2_3_26]|nr:hypothetical protein [Coleofasciculaceae cyanobacterium SM2_3_26]
MRFLTICVTIAGCSWEGSWEGDSWSLSGGAIAAHDLSAKGELSATVPLAGGDWRSTTYITLKAVGDITPGTNFSYYGLPPQPDLLFQAVRPLLAGADLLFGNLETTLTDHPTTIKRVEKLVEAEPTSEGGPNEVQAAFKKILTLASVVEAGAARTPDL